VKRALRFLLLKQSNKRQLFGQEDLYRLHGELRVRRALISQRALVPWGDASRRRKFLIRIGVVALRNGLDDVVKLLCSAAHSPKEAIVGGAFLLNDSVCGHNRVGLDNIVPLCKA
jgi:hypothetical protein